MIQSIPIWKQISSAIFTLCNLLHIVENAMIYSFHKKIVKLTHFLLSHCKLFSFHGIFFKCKILVFPHCATILTKFFVKSKSAFVIQFDEFLCFLYNFEFFELTKFSFPFIVQVLVKLLIKYEKGVYRKMEKYCL